MSALEPGSRAVELDRGDTAARADDRDLDQVAGLRLERRLARIESHRDRVLSAIDRALPGFRADLAADLAAFDPQEVADGSSRLAAHQQRRGSFQISEVRHG